MKTLKTFLCLRLWGGLTYHHLISHTGDSYTLVEFHHHAGVRDVLDKCTGGCIPVAVGVIIDGGSCAAVFPPPHERDSGKAPRGMVIVVHIRSAEPNPVQPCSWMNCCRQCVAGVSAVSRHTQTVEVGLRTHRERRIFRRGPQSSVSFYLKIHLSCCSSYGVLSQTSLA